jgi:U4/U6 small nuclear ribonucleoprotein PRP3
MREEKETKKRKHEEDDRRYERKRHDDRDRRSESRRVKESSSDHRRSSSRREEPDKKRHEREREKSPKRIKTEAEDDISIKMELKPKEVIAEELKTKEIMYQAREAIRERLRQMQRPQAETAVPMPSLKATDKLKPEEAEVYVDSSIEKVKRINELKSRLAKTNLSIATTPAAALDAMVAEKPKVQEVRTQPEAEGKIIEYLDPRLKIKGASRRPRATFEFKEQGEYQKLANTQRNKARLERLQSEISRAAQHTGISSAVKLALVTPSGSEAVESYIPEVEWWDEVVIGGGKGYVCGSGILDITHFRYDHIPPTNADPSSRYADSISELVEHPIQLKPPNQPTQPQYLKACLTAKERKKLRRQNRRESQKEKAEKIRLGLEKPPEPKVKISNLMKVLGNDAIQDPTRMEAHVRKQIMERMQKHQQENEERKLTKEQKSAKKIRKIAEDTSLAVHVAIYKVKSLANPSKKFKVHMNAKQLQMTGIILMVDDINVIIVEGGQKQQRFYKNLMMNRIKWGDEIAGQKKDARKDDVGQRNECQLIWEGIVSKRSFGEIRFVIPVNHKNARETLQKYNVPHYWDFCYSTTVLLSGDDQQ